MEADDTEAIKRLVESGFGHSILRERLTRAVFQKFRVDGRRLTRSLALAVVPTDCPRKLTESVASFLHAALLDRLEDCRPNAMKVSLRKQVS